MTKISLRWFADAATAARDKLRTSPYVRVVIVHPEDQPISYSLVDRT
jgi:hypothetical protein